MSIIASTGWTMVAWCKHRTVTTPPANHKSGFMLLDGVDDANDTNCMITFYSEDGNWKIASLSGAIGISPTSVSSATADVWYMLAINCYDVGAGRPRYRYSVNANDWTYIGSGGAGARNFKGIYFYDSVDDAKIYENTDYDAVDLAALYNGGFPSELTPPYPSTLRYYWKFNNSTTDEIGTRNLIRPIGGSYGSGILNGDIEWNGTNDGGAYYNIDTYSRNQTTSIRVENTKEAPYTTDVLLKTTQNLSVLSNSLLFNTFPVVHNSDILLKLTGNVIYASGALLKGTFSAFNSIDNMLSKTSQLGHTSDFLLKATNSLVGTSGALLKGTFSAFNSIDNLLSKTSQLGHTSNLLLKLTNSLAGTSGASLKGTLSAFNLTNVMLSKRSQINHTSNAILKLTGVLSNVVGALLKRYSAGLYSSLSAMLRNNIILNYVPIQVIYNISSSTLTLMVRECSVILSSVDSDIRYDRSAIVHLFPGRKLVIEADRVDAAQLERHYGQLAVSFRSGLGLSNVTTYEAYHSISCRVVAVILGFKQHSSYSHLRGVYKQILSVSDSDSNSEFGLSVATNDLCDVVLIGAPGYFSDTGRVYVYDRVGDSLNYRQAISGLDTRSGDRFGTNISMNSDGSSFIVCSPHSTDAGNLYVFYKDESGSFAQLQQIIELNFTSYSRFGHMVNISRDGGTLFISAPDKIVDGKTVGVVYVYRYVFGSFVYSQTITGIDAFASAVNGMKFGDGLDFEDGFRLLTIGAPGYNSGNGIVYVYKDNGSSFIKVSEINCNISPNSGIGYGSNLAFGGGSIFISATGFGSSGEGLVEQYDYNSNGIMTFVYSFVGGAGDGVGIFSHHAYTSSDVYFSGSNNGGVVYTFEEDNGQYILVDKIKPYGLSPDDRFGASVVSNSDGGYVVVGSPGFDDDSGVIYLFKKD